MRVTIQTIVVLALLSAGGAAQYRDGGPPRVVIAQTGSMEPTIPKGSRLLVAMHWYDRHPVQRFDIVLVKRPERSAPDAPARFTEVVARVIGIEGDRLALRDGRVYVNGVELDEPHTTRPCDDEDSPVACGTMAEVEIPIGQYFLLGDNRPNSLDSRYWSPRLVAREQLVGKIVEILPGSQIAAELAVAPEPAQRRQSSSVVLIARAR
jgi:signal peptidase I